MQDQYLFVYGTLRSDVNSPWHDRLIAPHFTLVGKASTAGSLYSLGEYPGLVEAPVDSAQVDGELYRFDANTVSLLALDEYEGCAPSTPQPHDYERKLAPVRLENGDEISAWCYYYLGSLAGMPRIASWE